jgi:tetratricopeptide (TPR) repeat protein
MNKDIVKMMQSGDFDSAIAQLNDIIAEDLENYEAILGVAISLLESGRLEESKKALDHFHNNADATYESYEALGIYYIRVDDYDKAEEYLLKGLELEPKAGNLYRNLAMAKAMQHDLDEADRYLQLALKYDPRNYLTRIAVAQFMIRDHNFGEAARVLLDILAANFVIPPDKAEYVMHLLAELENLQTSETSE